MPYFIFYGETGVSTFIVPFLLINTVQIPNANMAPLLTAGLMGKDTPTITSVKQSNKGEGVFRRF
jgi:hypothetical protein